MVKTFIVAGLAEWVCALKRFRVALLLARRDIVSRYRRSKIGPWWITISTAVNIAAIAAVFGGLFGHSIKEFLPHLTVGLILWQFISGTLLEGGSAFTESAGLLRQMTIPVFVFLIQGVARNLAIFFHNFAIVPFVFYFCDVPITLVGLISSFAGLSIVCANLLWMSCILAFLCSRFRDISNILGSILQIVFYMSPIIWIVPRGNEFLIEIMNYNFVNYFLELVRGNLIGELASVKIWLVPLIISILGWSIALYVVGRFKPKLIYWL